MNGKKALLILVAIGGLLLAGCAAGPNTVANSGPAVAGFWSGLWHGMICVITLIISIFRGDVSIYEIHNTGFGYNIGFLIGASVVLGGGGATAAKRRR